jgi:hypothetical protein
MVTQVSSILLILPGTSAAARRLSWLFSGKSAARVDRLGVPSTETSASSRCYACDGAGISRHLILTLQPSPTVAFQISNRHIEVQRINIRHIDRTDGYEHVSFFDEIDIAGHSGKAVR